MGSEMCIRDRDDIMVVRLGHLKDRSSSKEGKSSGGEPFTKDIYVYLEGGLKMSENVTKN